MEPGASGREGIKAAPGLALQRPATPHSRMLPDCEITPVGEVRRGSPASRSTPRLSARLRPARHDAHPRGRTAPEQTPGELDSRACVSAPQTALVDPAGPSMPSGRMKLLGWTGSVSEEVGGDRGEVGVGLEDPAVAGVRVDDQFAAFDAVVQVL